MQGSKILPELNASELTPTKKRYFLKYLAEFLLKREANTSILPAFELSIINNYFPEFENEITIKIKE